MNICIEICISDQGLPVNKKGKSKEIRSYVKA